MRKTARVLAVLAAVFLWTGCATQTIRLWEKGDALKDPAVLCVEAHPACSGNIVILETGRMPAPGDGPYEAEKVIELSEGGEVLRTWYMPVDEVILGVEGESIITGYGNRDLALKIGEDRFIYAVPIPKDEKEWIDCPLAAEREFPGSAYLQCSRHKDMKTGAKRILAYRGPCT